MRRPIDPPLNCSFDEAYRAIKQLPFGTVKGLKTTGKGVAFDATARTTGDGRPFINLPHNNRIYEGDWGYTTNRMGKDGQRIGQYARPIDEWCKKKGYVAEQLVAYPNAKDIATMSQKPTREELSERIQSLEKECAELRRQLRHLPENDNKYRTFFDNNLDGLFITKPDGAVLEANPAACAMFGYRLEELLRLGREAVVDPDDPRLALALQQRARNGYFSGELNFKRKDGTIVPVEVTSVAFNTKEGEERASIIVRDISERKLAKAQHDRQERLNQLLLDSIPCIAILLRPETREIVAMNKAAKEAGCEYNHTCYETWPKFQEPCPWCLASDLWGDGKARHLEFEALGAAWEAHWVPVSDDLYLHYAFDVTEQKLAQRKIEKQRYLLQSMEKISRVGGWEYELSTQKVSWTDGVYAIHDVVKGEFSPDDANRNIRLYHPEDQKIISKAFWGAVEKGAPYDLELRLHPENRAVQWVRTMGLPEMDGGRVVRVLGNIMDITERKQSEAALRESEAFTRAVLDNLPIGLAVNTVEPDVHFIYMNDKFCKFYRTAREDLVNPNTFWDVVYEDPDFRDQIRNKVLEDCTSGDTGRMYWENIPIVRRGKGTRYVCASNTPVPGKALMISTVWDVTGRVEMEMDLKKSEEQYRTLFESIDEGFCVIQVIFNAAGKPVDYRFLETNPAFEKQTGLHDANGQLMRSLAPDHEDHWFETYGRIVMTGRPERFQNEAKALGRWFDVYAFRIEAPEQRRVAVLFNDITARIKGEKEREMLQAQLFQAQKLESVGRLAGGVAHDYNNMLSVIAGYTELAIEKVPPESELHADLKEVQAAARRSIEITRQLLAFARKQTIDPQVVDLNELVESMLRMMRRLIGEDINLVWHPGRQLWSVKMDPTQVDQMLANLCVNARDAIEGVGTVTIETRNLDCDDTCCNANAGSRPGEFVVLTVSDDGCGMDKETLGRIFEPFFTTKGVTEGTGLGLATIYGIVQQNQGCIDVHSEPGQGTTFKIYLPRHAADPASVETETELQPLVGHGESVLVVEDEPAIMKMTQTLLQRLGYRVFAVGSPIQALQLAKTNTDDIDLLVTDVVMPEMNGRDLAHQMQALHPNLKILYMSGYTADVIAHRGVLEEDMHFIQKPFTLSDLGLKIRKAFDGG